MTRDNGGTATAPLLGTGNVDTERMPDSASKPRQRAPRARRGQLLVLPSARTGEGRRLREFRADLVAHVGGTPSATQRALIDRATVLQWHLTQMDAEALAGGVMSGHRRREYLAWDGALRRALVALGLKGAASGAPSKSEILRALYGQQEGAHAA